MVLVGHLAGPILVHIAYGGDLEHLRQALKSLNVRAPNAQADDANAYLVVCHGRYPHAAIVLNVTGRVFGN